ncbi:LLM class flavin-dependent oxidoreductase [Nocardioides mangrovicus]|uniref:LLM class flavin-dependent oxidoreductase n=1 Tax=Nocardioides mangrovicus TaxID=2478913 RepID=A0A3L8NYY0_9ACTN|nr:LLM class flavin-dependent oxidoreductase [Nocardioides mangrovicus]RLV48104.1 LLM class flavin-dependent oxidoreductase [Nocardioides mangrovicus]
MRFGLCILTDLPWEETEPRWRAAEELGFDHAWTYDHLVWGGLPESPWRGAMPTLTAAAMVTGRIGLGTFVTSPNFRHPVAFHREVEAIDEISRGRFLLALGAGGDRDRTITGGPPLSPKERVDRLQEFTDLTVRLRTEDHVSSQGRWFSADDARTLPRLTRVPLLLAGNGPRSVRYAARVGEGWVTTGLPADSIEEWFAGLARNVSVLDDALSEAGREPTDFGRYLSLDSSPRYSLESADLFAELVGRSAELGFTDLIVHWPRPQPPYAGSEDVLHEVAELLPRLRGGGV